MFQTKRNLRAKIAELERELEKERHHDRRSALVHSVNLPKCQSLACVGCAFAVFQKGSGDEIFLLGCGKELKCNDFTSNNICKLYPQRCYEVLQKDLEEQ